MKRIYSLDILRGFSLLGIILMNIVGFTHDIFHLDPFFTFQYGLNRVLYAFNILFIQQSFYPIFAFLFGYGLMMMKDSADKRGDAFLPIIYRRLIALFVFGILHGIFLFSGDILQTYAVVMLIGAPLLFVDKKFSVIASIILFGYYVMNHIVPFVVNGLKLPRYDYVINDADRAAYVAQVFNSGHYADIIALNAQHFFQYFFVTDVQGLLFRLSSLLPLMLMGSYARRTGWFERVIEDKRNIKWAIGLMISGLALKSLSLIFYGRYSAEAAGGYIGGVMVAASYMISIIKLSESSRFRQITGPMSLLGRMSFTVYILQSVIMFIITYSFKLYGQLNLIETYSIALVIYMSLIAFSWRYFSRFKQGPLEYLWRKITYLK
ncbi:DUF418 domain-containing protein [Macrococcus hajekii]|uniref:DUF418 domain-containing protein n=1 Tax=Macrococcus hajekii TaxID=198482 RepID=A0A4R6BIU1_9STAP|nr:DUF418 domain-containing protein [Macrococcus hajekii]TDM01582.1 DUF418 domain-containing protein [Macrococcus hajekii]GGB01198.1 hypothetical protein GCM10007190_06600 [Macrococcus hajekii]